MTDLERRLQALASDAFPAAPDVRAAVAARVAGVSRATSANAVEATEDPAAGHGRRAGSARRARRWRFDPAYRGQSDTRTPHDGAGPARAPRPVAKRRRVVGLALALVLVPTAAVAAVPAARDAVLGWLGLAHVRVERAPTVARLPALDRADLGRRVASVAEASRRAGFTVAVPDALPAPEAVYVSADAIVSLAYAPRAGLPRDPQTGLGVLVTQLRASGVADYIGKVAGPNTVVERVRVGTAPGVFLSGEAHELLVERPDRAVRPLPARLAGNTLAFERGNLVLRIEGRFDREHALALARSLR